jgi:hypothetical protein
VGLHQRMVQMTDDSRTRSAGMSMRSWPAWVILGCAVVCIAASRGGGQEERGTVVLVSRPSPFISSARERQAERQLDSEISEDVAMAKPSLKRMKSLDQRLSVVEASLARERKREATLMHKIHRAQHATTARAEYDVDVRGGKTKTIHEGYRQQGWTRGVSASSFDMPSSSWQGAIQLDQPTRTQVCQPCHFFTLVLFFPFLSFPLPLQKKQKVVDTGKPRALTPCSLGSVLTVQCTSMTCRCWARCRGNRHNGEGAQPDAWRETGRALPHGRRVD